MWFPLSTEARSALRKGSHFLLYAGVHHLPSIGGDPPLKRKERMRIILFCFFCFSSPIRTPFLLFYFVNGGMKVIHGERSYVWQGPVRTNEAASDGVENENRSAATRTLKSAEKKLFGYIASFESLIIDWDRLCRSRLLT